MRESIEKVLLTLRKSESITQAKYDKRFSTGFRIGILYGYKKSAKTMFPLGVFVPVLKCLCHIWDLNLRI